MAESRERTRWSEYIVYYVLISYRTKCLGFSDLVPQEKSFLFGHITASLRKHPFLLSLRRDVFAGYIIACVASVSVRFRSKRETFFARSLTLAPRSLLLNRTETLATQARHIINPLFPCLFGENRLKDSGLFSFLRFYWPWLLLGPIKT